MQEGNRLVLIREQVRDGGVCLAFSSRKVIENSTVKVEDVSSLSEVLGRRRRFSNFVDGVMLV